MPSTLTRCVALVCRGAWLALILAATCRLRAAEPPATAPKDADAAGGALHTATTHPMKYYLSLPKDWSAERKWPVLVAPSAHYGDKGRTLAMFAAQRDARRLPFILVSPMVINADRVAPMIEYRGAVADAIAKADAADGFRDEDARAKFDSEGILAVLRDLQARYRAEERVYITGFSSSTHIAYMFLFTHPELLRGVVINSGVSLARGGRLGVMLGIRTRSSASAVTSRGRGCASRGNFAANLSQFLS